VLYEDHGLPDYTFEVSRRLGVRGAVGDQAARFELGNQIPTEFVRVDIAFVHDGGRIGVIDQREQQVLKCRVFMVPLIRENKRTMKRLLRSMVAFDGEAVTNCSV
jgi:hypothetical protein